MKFYISTKGMKRVAILSAGDGGGGGGAGGGGGGGGKALPGGTRRISHRAVAAAALILGTVLPFFVVRIAIMLLESATVCSTSPDCAGWRFFGGSDPSLLRDELTRALMEASQGGIEYEYGGGSMGGDGGGGASPSSFKELVKDVTSNNGQDLKAFALKTKAMVLRMEHDILSAKKRESIYWHMASHGIPNSLHCLCLKMAEEYAVNSMARSPLPRPEYVSRLADHSFHHAVVLTDNVLAASVVVSSTIKNSKNPEKLVFHIVTDKKTYASMHAWFAINSPKSAVVEVKGLHQYDWSPQVNLRIMEMLEIQHLIWKHYNINMNVEALQLGGEDKRSLEALNPKGLSLINHLRVYIPELFPNLNKVVFLDDDIVVQHDLSPLWELHLNGKVNGAVVGSWCGEDCCLGRKYKDYLNFSNAIISSNFNSDHCGWLYGVNVFDLQAWRRTNITKSFHHWLKLNLNFGMGLWYPGVLAPALIAFESHVHPIDPSWQVAGLGRSLEVEQEILENAAVVHFSGPAKPWLEIGFPEVKGLWNTHVNISNEFVRKCGYTI